MSSTGNECIGLAVRITGPTRKQREYLCRIVQLFLTLCTGFIRNSTASYSIANVSQWLAFHLCQNSLCFLCRNAHL